jgi:hypothetical protein
LVNPFGERFQSRPERNQPSRFCLDPGQKNLVPVPEPLYLSLLNTFCSVLEEYL